MNPLTVRAFRRATDTAPLLGLLQSAETFDKTGERWSYEKLEVYLQAPGHRPERERWVVAHPTEPETLIGHACLYLPAQGDTRRVADTMLLVHPDWRRQGLGSRLWEVLEIHAAQHPSIETLRVYLDPGHEAGTTFAGRHGFTVLPEDAYRHLCGDLSSLNLDPTFPPGFTLVPYSQIQNLTVVVEAMNRSYAELHGHRTTTEQDFAPILEASDPDGFIILFDPAGRVMGTVSADLAPDLSEQNGRPTGRLGSPGVVPEHRSPAIYGALLGAGCHYLETRGAVWAELETLGDHETTIAAYQSLDFVLDAEAVAFTKRT